MKKINLALLLSLVLITAAEAAPGGVRVTCGDIPFSDLTKIEIQGTDLDGQFQIVESLYDSQSKKFTQRYSPVFGEEEFEKSEFPNLSYWNGYQRKLVRYGRGDYAILTGDECSQSTSALTCKETF